MQPALKFISSLGGSEEAGSEDLEDAPVVNQTVEDLIDLSAEQPPSEVSFSVQ